MKWGLSRPWADEASDHKADVKQWPFAKRTDGGAYLCQRSPIASFTTQPPSGPGVWLGEPVDADGYAAGHKLKVRHAGEQDLDRSMLDRCVLECVLADCPIVDAVPVGMTSLDRYFSAQFCLSDPAVIIRREVSGGNYAWSVQSYAMADDGTYPTEVLVVDGEVGIGSATGAFPRVAFAPSFQCRRVLVFHNIAHDGERYPDAVLRAVPGTQPPDGPAWRLRPKADNVAGPLSDWLPDSDIRFEPFGWHHQATGVIDGYRRYLAERWDQEPHELPVPDVLSTGAGPAHGAVSCTTLEFGRSGEIDVLLSGLAVYQALKRALTTAGRAIADVVPTGWRHGLILECSVFQLTRWEETSPGVIAKDRYWSTFGIEGRAVAVI